MNKALVKEHSYNIMWTPEDTVSNHQPSSKSSETEKKKRAKQKNVEKKAIKVNTKA